MPRVPTPSGPSLKCKKQSWAELRGINLNKTIVNDGTLPLHNCGCKSTRIHFDTQCLKFSERNSFIITTHAQLIGNWENN